MVHRSTKQDWNEKSREYADMGYIPVSMANDFAQIYTEGITKAAEQYQPPAWLQDALPDAA